jgi:hypothetical protein
MARTTMLFGIVLIVLGVVGYVGAAAVSVTALIPAMFGAVLVLLGWIASERAISKAHTASGGGPRGRGISRNNPRADWAYGSDLRHRG